MSGMLVDLTAPQSAMFCSKARVTGVVAGFGCISANTRIFTIDGLIPISQITSSTLVLSWSEKDQKLVFSPSGRSFPKGRGKMIQISTERAKSVVSAHHHIFSSDRTYQPASLLEYGDEIAYLPLQELTKKGIDQLWCSLDVVHYSQKDVDSLESYANEAHLYGQQFLSEVDIYQSSSPSQTDAQESFQYSYSSSLSHTDDQSEQKLRRIRQDLFDDLHDKSHSYFQKQNLSFCEEGQILKQPLEHTSACHRKFQQSPLKSLSHHNIEQHFSDDHSYNFPELNLSNESIVKVSDVEVNVYYDIQVLETNNYICENGFIHHNSGKTKSLLTKSVADLIKLRSDIAYFAPTVPLMRDIAYPVYSEIFEEMGMKYKINKSEGIIYTGFGNIICKSMENPDRIVGFEILKAYVDEFDILPTAKAELAFNKIAARVRLKPKAEQYKFEKGHNQIFIATTPEGYKATYNMFVKKPIKDSRLIQMSTYSNPHLPDGYIDGLKSQYPGQLIEAYLEGKFVNLTSGSVYDFDRDLHMVKQTYPTKTEPLHIGQDFNVGKMASVVFVKRKNSAGEVVWLVIDELMQSRDTPDVVSKIKERYSRNPIIIYPDASGRNRHTSNISKSDHSILRSAGFTVRVHNTNPLVKDRIASVNNAFYRKKVFVSEGCQTTMDSLEQQVYDRDGSPDKSNDLDHAGDAFGYFICKQLPVATSSMRYNSVKHL